MSQGTARVIFDAAMELPSGERRGYVARACAGARTMEEKVLALLAAHEGVGQFMGSPENPVAPARPAAEQAGDQVGPYRLMSVVGEGAFGTVWLAERREPFVQRVAMKIIKPGMDSRAVIARFEQERQALAVMDHPNVAKVLDGGLTPLGRPYFVMEYVKGEPITEFCDKNRLTIRQRLELFTSVCEAVQHAHMKGIIHRDLKPANILVSMVDTGGEGCNGHSEGKESDTPTADMRRPDSGSVRGGLVKVIDFGVAKAISRTLTSKTIFTEHGQIIGTPEYMAPEQAEMGRVDIDTRADVYSLGVVLYELLTGALPFDPRALRSRGLNEIQRIIREVDPPKPSMRLTSLNVDEKDVPEGSESALDIALHRHARLGDLLRELRRELDWVPLMAMRKDRRERYQSALAVAEDIRRYLRGRPLMAGPETARYRARKFVKRHRWGVGVTAAAVVGLAGFAGIGWGMYVDRAKANQRAEARAYEASIAAAGLDLDLGNVLDARARLAECQNELRDWEWGHLLWRTDWHTGTATNPPRPSMVRFVPDGGIAIGTIGRTNHELGVSYLNADLTSRPGALSISTGQVAMDRVLGMDAKSVVVLGYPVVRGELPRMLTPRALVDGRPVPVSIKKQTRAEGTGESDRQVAMDIQCEGSVSPDGTRAMLGALPQGDTPWILLVNTENGEEIERWQGVGIGGWVNGGAELITFNKEGVEWHRAGDGEWLRRVSWAGADVPARVSSWPQIAVRSGGNEGLVCAPNGTWTISWTRDTASVQRLGRGAAKSPSICEDAPVGAWIEGNGASVGSLITRRVLRVDMPVAPESVALSRDGRHLVAGMRNQKGSRDEVWEWELAEDSPVDWGKGAFKGVNLVASASGSSSVIVEAQRAMDRGPKVWIVGLDGKETEVAFQGAETVCAEEGGNSISISDLTGRISVRSGISGSQIRDWSVGALKGLSTAPPGARAESMAFVGSMQRLVASVRGMADTSDTRDIVVFGLDGSILERLGQLDEGQACVAAAATGAVAATAGRTLSIWPQGSGKPDSVRLAVAATVLAFDRTGKRLAVGTAEGDVIIYERGGGGWLPRTMKAQHVGSVRSLAFTRDGGRLLSGSGNMIVSDPLSGATLLRLEMGSAVLHLSFPGGEDRALAVMENGSIKWLPAPAR